jgi:2-dehydro-3-deoxyphosphooctonate aldolase (KDO 8-P synthase)
MNNFFFNLTSKSDPMFFLIAGPCVIENFELTKTIAATLKQLCLELDIFLLFKASYDKANRTSIKSYRGPGFDDGIRILQQIKTELKIPIISDIHLPTQAHKAAKTLDVIQIPAFLCRQTDLITAACQTGKPVNIKKGQFLSPYECRNIINKAREVNCKDIAITERGTFFGYNNLVVDFRSIQIIQDFNVPVIFDATHSIQLPGGAPNASAGERQFVSTLSKAAIAAGANGLFIETHPEPEKALCDGPNSIPLSEIETLLKTLLSLKKAL